MQSLFIRSNTGTAGDCATTENKMTLEKKLISLLCEASQNATFDVVAHELWHDGEGWSTNSSWYLQRGANLPTVLEAARGRWEVFKVNYCPKARVFEIADTGCESSLYIEDHCAPFLEIRPSRN
jgi:hypothetical protein